MIDKIFSTLVMLALNVFLALIAFVVVWLIGEALCIFILEGLAISIGETHANIIGGFLGSSLVARLLFTIILVSFIYEDIKETRGFKFFIKKKL